MGWQRGGGGLTKAKWKMLKHRAKKKAKDTAWEVLEGVVIGAVTAIAIIAVIGLYCRMAGPL